MKIIFSLMFMFGLLFANDATIEVIKKVDSLPSLGVEDSSQEYDETFKMTFFKSLVADLNVLSIFNVDRFHRVVDYDASTVVVENKDRNYVLRYKMLKMDSNALSVKMKLISNNEELFSKSYKVSRTNIYMFVTHAMAYDINEYMGEPSVAWMKRKVIFSRVVGAKKSEIVISDYSLVYQHTIVKGGFNLFPKWANEAQTGFYYSSLDGKSPTLKYVNLKTLKVSKIISSDGMMVCSDVSSDGNTLLLTMAKNGQPDIYTYKVDTKRYKRETRYGGIDVNAQFMGERKIIFISGRLGYPNVFSKDLDTKEVEQMVYYGKSNSACSSNGEYIVYKARETSNAFERNTFNLHLISMKTDFIRRLTVTGNNEFPRFSKDGDAILFIKNYKNQSSIGIIRLNHNKNYLFPLKYGKVQSMDW